LAVGHQPTTQHRSNKKVRQRCSPKLRDSLVVIGNVGTPSLALTEGADSRDMLRKDVGVLADHLPVF